MALTIASATSVTNIGWKLYDLLTIGIIGKKLSFAKRLLKLDSAPSITDGLIITVFLKFVSALTSP